MREFILSSFSKLPLLVSDCKPQMELVQKEKCGIYFRSEDTDDLKEKIIYLYENQHLLKSMGENGKLAIRTTYQLKNYRQSFCQFIRETLPS
ncbi:MAG: glycosyltransferase [Saprospiraceae bacterium]